MIYTINHHSRHGIKLPALETSQDGSVTHSDRQYWLQNDVLNNRRAFEKGALYWEYIGINAVVVHHRKFTVLHPRVVVRTLHPTARKSSETNQPITDHMDEQPSF